MSTLLTRKAEKSIHRNLVLFDSIALFGDRQCRETCSTRETMGWLLERIEMTSYTVGTNLQFPLGRGVKYSSLQTDVRPRYLIFQV